MLPGPTGCAGGCVAAGGFCNRPPVLHLAAMAGCVWERSAGPLLRRAGLLAVLSGRLLGEDAYFFYVAFPEFE